MTTSRLVGLVLLACGLVALWLANQQSNSVADQTKHFFTGEYRDKTTLLYLGGGVGVIVGLGALAFGGKKRAAS